MIVRWWREFRGFKERWQLLAMTSQGWSQLGVVGRNRKGYWYSAKITKLDHFVMIPNKGVTHNKRCQAMRTLVHGFFPGKLLCIKHTTNSKYSNGWMIPPRVKRRRQLNRI